MQLFDKNNSNDIHFVRKLIISISIIVVFIAAVVIFSINMKSESSGNPQKLDTGWDVIINDSIYEDVTLSTFRIPEGLEKGDVILLKNTLPTEFDGDVSCLMLLIYLTTVDANIDGQNIYSYGNEEYENGFVGSGYHFIQLPYQSEGKEISIVLKPSEAGAFTNIPTPVVVDSRYAPTTFTDKNVLNIFICIFLFMLGASITIVSAISFFFNTNAKRLVVIGILASLIGAWSLGNTKVLQMFSINLEVNTVLEYLTLYVAPIPLIGLIIMMRQDDTVWKKRTLFLGMFAIILFGVISTILHFTNVVHYPSTLTAFHFLAFGVLIIAAVAGRKKFSLMDRAERLLNFAIIVLCVFAGLDIIRFNFSKYVWPENELIANSILPFGTLVFVILLVGSYLMYLYDMIKSKAESMALSKMAYNDPLTGLYNRAKAEETFAKLLEKQKDYFLINLDLNGLKRMNDQFGHEKGDLLITSFADILRTCFDDIGTVVRMGGDEFLIIIDSDKEELIKPALANMIKLESEKSKETGMRIEASFGISSNIEDRSRNPEQVYSVADSRMYSMKQKTKAARRAKAQAADKNNE